MTWDEEIDFLIVGSGAAGLSAAIVAAEHKARIKVIEKSAYIGGTSATSGGGVWIPCSPLATAMGEQDSPQEAFDYIRALAGDGISNERIEAFVRAAPTMLNWMAEHTELRFNSVPYPDYHPEAPGAKIGWRTHFPEAFDGRRLGKTVNLIREASPAASFLGIVNWTLEETHFLLHRPKGWKRVFAKLIWRYISDIPQRLHSRRDRFLTLGNAIIGSLVYALHERDVEVQCNTGLLELISENGAVVGALIEHNGKALRIKSQAVLLATGGFERNAKLRARFLPKAGQNPEMSGSQESNLGDAIGIAEAVDAKLLNTDSAWWAPVFKVPGEYRARLCAFERAFPGCIMVNQRGERYMNEASSYHVAAQKMINEDETNGGAAPSWIIFDARFRKHYPMGPLLPIPFFLHPAAIRNTVTRAGTIEQLAKNVGVPPDALQATLEHFNRNAEKGEDPDFQRGATEYDRYYGDPKVSPNPTLLPIDSPPYYAMQLHVGDIGTNGGLASNEHAQVLDSANEPIAGLYAAGNCSASVMGHCYPAAGGTLGPALSFGFLAAHHALKLPRMQKTT
jgi:3-oxosteroid 1-dehydrogenase